MDLAVGPAGMILAACLFFLVRCLALMFLFCACWILVWLVGIALVAKRVASVLMSLACLTAVALIWYLLRILPTLVSMRVTDAIY